MRTGYYINRVVGVPVVVVGGWHGGRAVSRESGFSLPFSDALGPGRAWLPAQGVLFCRGASFHRTCPSPMRATVCMRTARNHADRRADYIASVLSHFPMYRKYGTMEVGKHEHAGQESGTGWYVACHMAFSNTCVLAQ